MPIYYLPLLILFFLATGCTQNVDGSYKLPLVYRIDVQQGNVVDQEMINNLKPGMEKEKVKYILGTPMIRDPFHNNRWDYVYSMEPGGGEREQRRITLYFRGDKLAYIDGDIQVNANLQPKDIVDEKERSISVPLEESEEGFFSRMFNKEDEEKTADEALEPETPETATTEITNAEEPGTTGESAESTESTESTESEESLMTRKKDESTETESQTASADSNEPERNSNLLKRFWDRMTSGADDSTIAEGEESERDRRDAEMLEQAGGGL